MSPAGGRLRATVPAIPAGTLSVCLPLASRSRPGRGHPPGNLSQGLARLVGHHRRWEPARLALPHHRQHHPGPVPQAAKEVGLPLRVARMPRRESRRCASLPGAFSLRYPRARSATCCTICRNTTARSCSCTGPTRTARSRGRCTCPCRPPGCAFFARGRRFKCITWNTPRAQPHLGAAHDSNGRRPEVDGRPDLTPDAPPREPLPGQRPHQCKGCPCGADPLVRHANAPEPPLSTRQGSEDRPMTIRNSLWESPPPISEEIATNRRQAPCTNQRRPRGPTALSDSPRGKKPGGAQGKKGTEQDEGHARCRGYPLPRIREKRSARFCQTPIEPYGF